MNLFRLLTLSACALALSRVAGAQPVSPRPRAAAQSLPSVLPNGVTLVARPDQLAPRLAISILVRAGAADETAQNAGWRRLLGEAMLRGTNTGGKTLTGTDLSRRAEELGGTIGLSVGDDFVEVYATGESENAAALAQLALDLVLRPRLSDEDVDAARKRLLERNEDGAESVALRASQALETRLFRDARGEPVAYGLPTVGTPETLTAITAAQLRTLHTQYFSPARLVIGASGDVDEAALRQVLGAGEAALPETTGAQPAFTRPNPANPPLTVRQFPSGGAWVVVGFAGAGASSPDAPATRVLLSALTDSRVARLPARLLKAPTPLVPGLSLDEGVTQVQGQWLPRRFASEVALFAQTSPGNVENTKNALLDEVRRLREGGLSAAELEAAKNYARGSFAVEREALRERAFNAALFPFFGAGSDEAYAARLQAVTLADIKRVAAKYFDAYAVALVMPREEAPEFE